MPDIDASIYRPYRDDGVLVYGLHPGDPPAQVADFVEQTGITFPVLRDPGTISRFRFPEGVGYPYPRDVVIGPDLTVLSIRNSFNQDEVLGLVEEHLLEE